jgi:hypothetical protein
LPQAGQVPKEEDETAARSEPTTPQKASEAEASEPRKREEKNTSFCFVFLFDLEAIGSAGLAEAIRTDSNVGQRPRRHVLFV